MSTIPRAAPSRPVWAPVPFLRRARSAFAWAAVSGVLGALAIVAGRWAGENDTNGVVLALLAVVLLATAAACVALFLLAAAAGQGPGDGMSGYGAGRRVEVAWASRGHERGTVEVEDVGRGEVVALPREGQAPHVTVRLGGHDLLVQSTPGPAAPDWYTLVDDAGYTVARADAARCPGAASVRAPVDWTVRPARGPVLRLRHRPAAPVPVQVTLLDELGAAWWVRERSRAELPDDLDPASAVFVVLLVDQLARARTGQHS
ncbi:hypothetical protein [Actinomycetospora cinnamomea]|nr:hypothetical protein [Actinomycetospora cinnamomea]